METFLEKSEQRRRSWSWDRASQRGYLYKAAFRSLAGELLPVWKERGRWLHGFALCERNKCRPMPRPFPGLPSAPRKTLR